MAIKAIIDKLDDVPEPFREHYTEKDGKFYLSVDAVNGWSLEDVSGLKTALSKERTDRQKFETDLAKYKDLDPDKARKDMADLEELRKLDPNKEADKIANQKFESAKQQLIQSHQTELTKKDERINFLTGAVDGLQRDQRATAAIAAAKGSVKLLLPHVLGQTRTVEKDGKFVVEVIDSAGNVKLNNKGDPLSIDELIAEMKASEDFASAFEGTGQTGTGKQEDKGGGKTGQQGKGDFGGTREERAKAIASKFNLPIN